MSGVAGLGVDERRARVVLAMLAEPDDSVTSHPTPRGPCC